jgi:hypothetical protein
MMVTSSARSVAAGVAVELFGMGAMVAAGEPRPASSIGGARSAAIARLR